MKVKDERFEVENEDAERALRTIAVLVDQHIPANMGFGLLLFDLGDGGAIFWISSAEREDMITAMKEFIAKNETPKSKTRVKGT